MAVTRTWVTRDPAYQAGHMDALNVVRVWRGRPEYRPGWREFVPGESPAAELLGSLPGSRWPEGFLIGPGECRAVWGEEREALFHALLLQESSALADG